MTGIYFSGTGNTKYCTEKLVRLLDETAQTIPMEDNAAADLLSQHDFIILAYPVQYSNMPVMVRDFIKNHAGLWRGKKVLCLATMALFSGDGAGCLARLLRKYGAEIVGGLHICMPDSICDVKLLKKSAEKNRAIIKSADLKIEKCAKKIRQGRYPKDGLYFYSRVAGFLGQRLWFNGKTKDYTDRLKISSACTGCGLCASLCPMKNMVVESGRAISRNRCTMCYRCINSCPAQAITLLGDTVVAQYRFDKYADADDSTSIR